MKKSTRTPMKLNAETVRRLTSNQLQYVNGGMFGAGAQMCKTALTECTCETSSTWDSHCCAVIN
jgi:hypothetical protein